MYFSYLSQAISRELLLKNRSTNRLLLELKEERVQRLQDLEEIYDKDRQVESLTNEVVCKNFRYIQSERM